MKRICFISIAALFSMCPVAVAAEEEILYSQAEPEDEVTMRGVCTGQPPQQMVACCTAYAEGAYAQCAESLNNNMEGVCQQELFGFCQNYAAQYMPPNCYGSSACMIFFNQAFVDCLNSWEAQQMLYSCMWDWTNRLIPMLCQSEKAAAFSYCMSGN